MTKTLRTSAQRVQDILNEHHCEFTVVELAQTTRTAQEAAAAIGCTVAQIAKTLIFKGKTTGRPYCVIASGVNRVDEKKVEALVHEPIEKPDADFVVRVTGFAIGGVSPVGLDFEVKPFIDEDLQQFEEIWAAAGTPFAVFRLTPANLVTISGGTVVTVKKS